ncbi:MAG: lipopolysaccharide biosynthesis protein [Planctomycetes bacterium]|nr:lipopolysaccharide biosynthesis protein [Planctomycetota bacterium]
MALSLADKAGFLALGQGAARLARFAFGIVLVNLLCVADYGLYQQVWLVYSLAEMVMGGAVGNAVVYRFHQVPREDRPAVIHAAALVGLAAGALVALGLAAAAAPLAALLGPGVEGPLRVFSLYCLLSLPGYYLYPVLHCLDRSVEVAPYTVLFTVIEGGTVVGAAALGASVTGLVLAVTGAAALRLVVTAAATVRLVGLPAGGVGRAARDLVAYALPLCGSRGVLAVDEQLDRWFVAWAYPVDTFAVYVRGATRLPLLGIVSSSAVSVVQPTLAELYRAGDTRRFCAVWHASLRKVALVLFPSAVFFLAAGEAFFRSVFPPAYAAGAPVFRLYLLLLFFQITAFSNIYMVTGRSAWLLPISLGQTAVHLVAVALAIGPMGQTLGLVAPAVATVAVGAVAKLLDLVLIGRFLGVGLRGVLPWRVLGGLLAAALAAGAAAAPVLWAVRWPVMAFLGSAALYGSAYLGVLAVTGQLGELDRALLRRWVRLEVFRSGRRG